MKKNVWYPEIPNYIDVAFQAARDADNNALLFYNDYGAEGLGGKADQVYTLVKSMVSRGVPIDGVGLQMHVNENSAPEPTQVHLVLLITH